MKVKLFISLLLLSWISVDAYSQSTSLKDLVYRKKFAEVVKRSESFTAADSANFETMFALAQAYEGLLKNKEAYRCYQYCMKQDSSNVDLLNAIGRTAGSLGHTQEALGCFQKVLQADSVDFYANYQMARLYMQQGEYVAAAYNFQYLLQFDPENPTIWKNLGDCQLMMPMGLAEGIASYEKAFSLNPENAALAHLLINTLLPLGNEEIPSALEVCDTALRYNPTHKMLIRDKAITLYMNRDYGTADSLFTLLLARQDSSYINLKYGGASRYKNKMFMDAIDPLEKAWGLDTTSVEVNLLLGATLGKTYDRKRAFMLLDKAERYMQPSTDLTFQLALYRGEVYTRDGNLMEANKYFGQAYDINPDRLDVLQKMSMLLYESKAEKYKTEAEKQRGLYNVVTFVKAMLDRPDTNLKYISYYKPYLKSFAEEMFFKQLDKAPMTAPNGKKSYITKQELQDLINKIPDQEKKKDGMHYISE